MDCSKTGELHLCQEFENNLSRMQHHNSGAGEQLISQWLLIVLAVNNRIATYLFLVIIPHVTAIVSLECVIRCITEYGLQLNKERKIITQSLNMVRSIFHMEKKTRDSLLCPEYQYMEHLAKYHQHNYCSVHVHQRHVHQWLQLLSLRNLNFLFYNNIWFLHLLPQLYWLSHLALFNSGCNSSYYFTEHKQCKNHWIL